MQLTQTVKRQLEISKSFMAAMLKYYGRVQANVVLEEEPGEVLITLLMTDEEIHDALKQVVKEFFGVNYVVTNISIICGKKLITFTIVRNC